MNIKDLKNNISLFNTLNDEQVQLIFMNSEFSDNDKNYLMEYGYQRICALPMSIFIKCIGYANMELWNTKYGDKINSMTYDELVTLVYDKYCDDEFLLYVEKSSLFHKYLNEERDRNDTIKLQIFDAFFKLNFYNENQDELNKIGLKIKRLIPNINKDPKNIKVLVDSYLSEVIEQIDKIRVDSEVLRQCMDMINQIIRLHIKLDSKMIQFYTKFRIKELGLNSYCKDVTVNSNPLPDCFCLYTPEEEGSIIIFYQYIDNVYKSAMKRINSNQDISNDLLNEEMLQLISHELGHVMSEKKKSDYKIHLKEETFDEKLKANSWLNYAYKNNLLKYLVGNEKYSEYHDEFIEENRADIFAIFDIDRVTNTYFKAAFSKDMQQRRTCLNINKLISMYLEKSNDGITISSPIERFDKLFSKTVPHDISVEIPSVSDENRGIMDNLFSGNSIPIEVLQELDKIRSLGVPTNLCLQMQAIIETYETGYEEELTNKKIRNI